MRNNLVKSIVLLVIALLILPHAPATAQEKVTITFWHMEQPPYRVERFQTLIDEFNAANPDIEVKQEAQNWGEIYTKAPAAVAAGNAPELLFAIPDFTPILRDLGAVQPVEDFVAELDATRSGIARVYSKKPASKFLLPGMSGWPQSKHSPKRASMASASPRTSSFTPIRPCTI